MMLRVLVAGALAAIIAGPAAAQQASQAGAQKPAGAASDGAKLYVAQGCYECHGTVGQGSSFSGPRLVGPVLPREAFLHQLREPRAEMPPYTDKVLSDRQVDEIIAYLQSVPEPQPADSIALLK